MPYFYKEVKDAQRQRYFCPNHNAWFFYNASGMTCLVAHAPGTCCHWGEEETTPDVAKPNPDAENIMRLF